MSYKLKKQHAIVFRESYFKPEAGQPMARKANLSGPRPTYVVRRLSLCRYDIATCILTIEAV